MKIVTIIGERSYFMKITQLIGAIKYYNPKNIISKIEHFIVSTRQHYDIKMSQAFFRELSITYPDINLEIGSGSYTEQIGSTLIAFGRVLLSINLIW